MTEERMFSVGDIDVPAAAQPELAGVYDQLTDDMKQLRKTADPQKFQERVSESVLPNIRKFMEIVTAKVGLIEHLIESGQLGGGPDDDDLHLDEEQANLFLSTLESVQALVNGMADAAIAAPPEQKVSLDLLKGNVEKCIAILKEHFDDGDEPQT